MRKKTTLKDIACFSKGSQINGDLLLDEGKYEYLNGGTKASGTWNEFNVNGKTITISEGGNSCGYVNFMKEKFWCGAHCYYLFDVKCKPKYLYYLLKGNQTNLMKLRSGACMPNIKKSDLGNFKFVYDNDMIHQNKIISIFDDLTNVIDFYEKQMKYLDNLVKARFIEMFGDPVLNERKLPTLSGADFFKLSNGRAVPDEKRIETGIPAYGGNGISWYTDEFLMAEDTIVVGRVGFQSGNVHYVIGPLWITDNAMYISQYDKDKFNLRFLCELMQHVNFSRFQDAGDLKKITQKPFMTFKYILPSMDLQQKFVNFKIEVDKSRFDIKKSITELEREVVYD